MIIPELAPVWETFYLMDILTCILLFEISRVIYYQWRKHHDMGARSKVFLAFAVLLGTFGAVSTLLLYRRYFVEFAPNDDWYRIGIILLTAGALLFSFVLEGEFSYVLHTRHLISIALLLLIVLQIVLFRSEIGMLFNTAAAMLIIFVSFIFVFYIYRKSSGPSKGNTRLMFWGSVGFVILFSGNSDQGSEFILASFPDPILVLLLLKMIFCVSVPIIIKGFSGSPLLLEIDWKTNLIALFVIDPKSGTLIYQKRFKSLGKDFSMVKDSESIYADILGGGVANIIAIIKDIGQSNRSVKEIAQKNMRLLVEIGDKIAAVFVVKQNLGNLQYLLARIVSQTDHAAKITPYQFEHFRDKIMGEILKQEIGKLREVPYKIG